MPDFGVGRGQDAICSVVRSLLGIVPGRERRRANRPYRRQLPMVCFHRSNESS